MASPGGTSVDLMVDSESSGAGKERWERWERLEELFERALEISEPERARFLEKECGEDVELRRDVLSLLEAADTSRHLAIERRFLREPGEDIVPPVHGDAVGQRIGPYTLEELVGEGGMGAVYRASRSDGAFEQQVALKLIRSGLASADLRRRFRLERQLLAQLSHPNITQLLDGGLAEDGRPYLVMQYVSGTPITRYSDAHVLSVQDRLKLFATACRAVQHAHQNLVVHRDLKPSNILVTEDGTVKLLDFGIAKLLDPETETGGDDAAGREYELPLTQSEVRLMTPHYAAPEQVMGAPVTTATDVYSLGVLLYELLAGTRPYEFEKRVPAEIERVVCDYVPPRPSVAAGTDPDTGKTRPGTSSRLRRTLQGDLDNIVMSALRKEPEQRYGSAGQFADDIDRYLDGMPVHARKDTLSYRVQKFVRRNRAAVAAAAIGAVLVSGFAVVSGVQAFRLSRQATVLESERDRARQVVDFVEGLFAAGNPYARQAGRRDTLRIRDFLAESEEQVTRDLSEQPVLQADLLQLLGEARMGVGDLPAAESLVTRSLAVRKMLYPGDSIAHADVAASSVSLGRILFQSGRSEAAEPLFRSAIAYLDADRPDMLVARAKARHGLGSVLQDRGEFANAGAVYRQAVSLNEAAFGVDHPDVATSKMNLATTLVRLDSLDAAEALMGEAVRIQERDLPEEHPLLATTRQNLAYVYSELGRYDEAEPLYRKVLAVRRSLYESPHPQIAVTVNNLAFVYLQREDYEEAERLYLESLEMREALYGKGHPRTATVLVNLGTVLSRTGQHRAAAGYYEQAREALRLAVGESHPAYATATGNLARAKHLDGQHTEAVEYYMIALAVRREAFAPNHRSVLRNSLDLAECLIDVGRPAEAGPLLDDVQKQVESTDSGFEQIKERLAAVRSRL